MKRENKLSAVPFENENLMLFLMFFRFSKACLASIYCFNVPVPASILESAAKEEVPILTFNVIYKLIDTLKEDISSKLSPIVERKLVGEGHVLKQFMIPDGIKKKQPVAGVLVDSGVFDK